MSSTDAETDVGQPSAISSSTVPDW